MNRNSLDCSKCALPVILALAITVLAAAPEGGWTDRDLIRPEQLVPRLAASAASKPLILYVGFPFLYRNKHIPGALFAGPTARPQGLEALKTALHNVPRNRELVVYCGCCPWDKCPNIKPAYEMLRQLGYSRVKLLVIPTNFATDWTGKGYPVEAGAGAAPPSGKQ